MAIASTTSAHAFGIALKRARRAARLTQAQLAERAGFSVVYISMLERGARAPQRTAVVLLADALALTTPERYALETAAQLPARHDQRASAATGAAPSQPPIGGFLGATPTGPLIGREGELAVIQAALAAVGSGHGRLLFLVGEPGVGKTRLAQEIMLRAHAHGFLVATGCCYEPQQTVAYYPFLAALSQIFAAASTALQQEVARRWPLVTRLLPQHELEHPTLDALSVDPGGGEDARQRLYWQVAGFLRAVVSECPLTLLLDDLHWADTGSLELLRHLAHVLRGEPILFVGTYRDVEVGRQHPLEGALRDLTREDLLERLAVRRLGEEETTALIGATLGAHDGAVGDAASVAADLAHRIYARSEGNAFFTRQLARALHKQGDLAFAQGQWRLGDSATPAVAAPESIRSVIGQRLDRLTPLTQEILREASVLGQVFAFEDLQRMASRSEQEIEEALEEAAGIVREGEQDRYHFNHALTRDTLYAELSARRKRRLHRAAAEAIEQGTPQERERRAAELSYHFLEADEGARALPYALLAGHQAEAVYAHTEAAGHYREALEVVRELGDQLREAQALEQLARTLVLQGRGEEALELAEQSLRLNATLGDYEAQARLAQVVADVHTSRGTPEDGVARLQALMATLSTAELSAHGQARLYRALGAALIWSAQFATGPATIRYARAALEALTRALEYAQQAGDDELLLEILLPFGLAHEYLARQDESLRVWEEMIPLAEAAGRVDQLIAGLLSAGYVYLYNGQFGACRTYFERALALTVQHDWLNTAWMCNNYGELEYLCRDWAQAQAHFERGAAFAGGSREVVFAINIARIWRGLLFVLQGDQEQGASALEEPLLWAERHRHLEALRMAHGMLAERDLLAGRFEEARARLEPLRDRDGAQANDMRFIGPQLAWAYMEVGDIKHAYATIAEVRAYLPEGQGSPYLPDTLRVGALIATRQRRYQEATDTLEEALTLCGALPYPYAEAKALWVYGRLETERGDPGAARKRFTQALLICDRLGEGLYRTYLERDLRRLARKQ